MRKFNLYSSLLVFAAIFTIVLIKIIVMPISCDETATSVHYINYTFWQIMMYPDSWPNNHILNTLLVKVLAFFFGREQVVVRIPSLLSFIVYVIAVYRINKTILKENSVFFVPSVLFFTASPYLLDFFVVSRGYGISTSLVTLCVSYLITGFQDKKSKHIWFALAFSILASYANFSALVFWSAVTIFAALSFFINSDKQYKNLIKPYLIIGFISILYLALIATPILKMQKDNQFQYWNSNGFYKDTMLLTLDFLKYDSHFFSFLTSRFVSYIIFFVIGTNMFFVYKDLKNNNFKLNSLNKPVFVSTLILLLTAFVSIMQCTILHTPNLTLRTALFFIPLFITSFVCTLSFIEPLKKKALNYSLAGLISFLCIFHVSTRYNFRFEREHWFDENTFDVLNYLKSNHSGEKKTSLKTWWWFYPSFDFYYETGKTPWLDLYQYDQKLDTACTADYYYVFAEDYPKLESKFEVVYKPSWDRWLLKKK